MSTQTDRFFSRKSSGRCGQGIKLNHVNFMSELRFLREGGYRISWSPRSPDLAEPAAARAAQARVEEVTQGVTQHVEAEDGERDRGPGPDRHPGGGVHVGAPGAGEHRPPRRVGRGNPEAEKGQGRLREDGPAEPDGGEDDDGGGDVGEDIAPHYAEGAGPHRPGGLEGPG